jgi:putative transposase
MPRGEFEGAVYHVLCRGNRREAIFRNDRDRELFLETLEEACGRTGWRVHALVLMGKHYHPMNHT